MYIPTSVPPPPSHPPAVTAKCGVGLLTGSLGGAGDGSTALVTSVSATGAAALTTGTAMVGTTTVALGE